MIVLGIDPGGTTGLCWIEQVSGLWIVTNNMETTDLYVLKEMMERADTPYVVCESVVAHGQLTIGKMLQLKAVGVIESVVDVDYITPEERGRVKKAPKLVGKHAQDAYRVAVAFALKKGLMTRDDAEHLSSKAQ